MCARFERAPENRGAGQGRVFERSLQEAPSLFFSVHSVTLSNPHKIVTCRGQRQIRAAELADSSRGTENCRDVYSDRRCQGMSGPSAIASKTTLVTGLRSLREYNPRRLVEVLRTTHARSDFFPS